jgi:hypothetical protein
MFEFYETKEATLKDWLEQHRPAQEECRHRLSLPFGGQIVVVCGSPFGSHNDLLWAKRRAA